MKKLYALLTVIALVLSACGGDASNNGDALSQSLENTKWELVEYGYKMDSKTSVLPNSKYTLLFSNNVDVNGTIDCNTFSSTYSASEGEITIVPFGATEIGCPQLGNGAYETEVRFVNDALYSARTYSKSNVSLIITAADSSQLIFLKVEN